MKIFLPVGGIEVYIAMKSAGIEQVSTLRCSICGYQCSYVRRDDELFYDGGCYCTEGRNLSPRAWSVAADFVNMQTNPEMAERVRRAFGLPIPPDTEDPK